MASKFKLTGFARFFFAMAIIVPLAYFGASYYNGEDGVAKLKKMIGIDLAEDTHDTTDFQPQKEEKKTTENKSNDTEVARLNKRIDELESENERLNRLLKNREREIELLKKK
ncbi:MAG: hypothetical protein KDC85_05465 [Saprospiraceae bacterium]|nr:hypothetical protein [Saprospiraceae bacterium]MCB9324952.1 hypothetical protein [Lewinellaceae bacterium]